MDRDQNLLFGVLAVQLRRVTPQQMVEAGLAWSGDPSQDLAARLVAMGALSEADRALISEFVDRAVAAHDGDASQTLSAFGGEKQIYETFQGSLFVTPSGGISAVPEITPTPEGETDTEIISAVHEVPGRYLREREYARGGMGRVLLVHDDHLGREIALKELLPVAGASYDPDTPNSPVRKTMPLVARFLQEARITGQLEHPSIVPVYELGHRKDGSLYYTMKLVRGKTLSEAIKEADTVEKRLKLLPHFVDLCNAMAYAHSRKVIHRDLKPGNVMVGEFGETVVLDWGLAKHRSEPEHRVDPLAETLLSMRREELPASARTSYGQALGTPAYMPPEQARGELEKVDERSDVYSLGAVLYQILTGRPPFQGHSVYEILEKVQKGAPDPVRSLVRGIPPELAAICHHALQREAADRYQSAKELAEDVDRFLTGGMVQAHRYGILERIGLLATRHRAIISTAAIALVVLLGVGAWSYLQIAMERNQAMAALTRAEEAEQAAMQRLKEVEEANKQTDNAKAAEQAALSVVAKLRESLRSAPEVKPVLEETGPEGMGLSFANIEDGDIFSQEEIVVTLAARSNFPLKALTLTEETITLPEEMNEFSYSFRIRLSEGENVIRSVTSDAQGNELEIERLVVYEPSELWQSDEHKVSVIVTLSALAESQPMQFEAVSDFFHDELMGERNVLTRFGITRVDLFPEALMVLELSSALSSGMEKLDISSYKDVEVIFQLRLRTTGGYTTVETKKISLDLGEAILPPTIVIGKSERLDDLVSMLGLALRQDFPLVHGSVVGLAGSRITFDLGKRYRIRENMKCLIYREIELKHPTTGEIFAIKPEVLGECIVTEVGPELSTAELLRMEDQGSNEANQIRVGDYIRIK